jgi:hypothetical protein
LSLYFLVLFLPLVPLLFVYFVFLVASFRLLLPSSVPSMLSSCGLFSFSPFILVRWQKNLLKCAYYLRIVWPCVSMSQHGLFWGLVVKVNGKVQFCFNSDKNNTLNGYLKVFLSACRALLAPNSVNTYRKENISDKGCRKMKHLYLLCFPEVLRFCA